MTAHSTHHHSAGPDADQRAMVITFVLIVAFMAVEVVVGVVSGSLALLADAGHMVTDALAIAGAVAAGRLARRPATSVWTYGLPRAEVLSAAVNGVVLVVAAALVTLEAARRLAHPVAVSGPALLITAGVGVAVNVTATWTMARANRRAMHVEGVFQHVVTDLYAFIATLAAGAVVVVTGFRRADPLASLVVVALMCLAAWRLLAASGRVLLEAAPDTVDLDEVRQHLLETPHVTDVHDLHAWALTSDLPALSAHVVVADCCFDEGHAPWVLDQLQSCLAGHFDLEHSTFQLEPASHGDHERGHHR